MDVSVKHLSKCERGVSTFSLERLLDICEIFDVSLDYLVRGLPTDDPQLNFPQTMVDIFRSGDAGMLNCMPQTIRLGEHPDFMIPDKMTKGSPQWAALIKEKAANRLLIYCLILAIFTCYLCRLFLNHYF